MTIIIICAVIVAISSVISMIDDLFVRGHSNRVLQRNWDWQKDHLDAANKEIVRLKKQYSDLSKEFSNLAKQKIPYGIVISVEGITYLPEGWREKLGEDKKND